MVKQTVKVKNAKGLHARPASEFTKLANTKKCDVYLEKEGKRINAKSILGILTLAIGQGNIIDVITEGENEKAALMEFVEFIENFEE